SLQSFRILPCRCHRTHVNALPEVPSRRSVGAHSHRLPSLNMRANSCYAPLPFSRQESLLAAVRAFAKSSPLTSQFLHPVSASPSPAGSVCVPDFVGSAALLANHRTGTLSAPKGVRRGTGVALMSLAARLICTGALAFVALGQTGCNLVPRYQLQSAQNRTR